eukprot:COSAG01_NODE_168_length_23206_cov_14.301467_29_plen_61_part_00
MGQYGNLYRCNLANGEQRWLCPYHAAHAKGEVELQRPQVRRGSYPVHSSGRPPPPHEITI